MTLACLAKDLTAPRPALAIFVVLLHERLVSDQWARLKLAQVELATGRHRDVCHDCLRWLVQQGYLERRDEPFVGLQYRVPRRAA